MADLNERQKLFIQEYCIDRNATQAAIRAGYSKKTADAQSSRLLTNVRIRQEIDAKIKRLEVKSEISAERILKEVFRIATCDLREAFDEQGRLKDIHSIPEDVARCISGVEVDELFEGLGQDRIQIGVTKKIKFWDKSKNLENLMKHLKLLTDKVEIEIVDATADRIKAAREKLGKN